MESQDQKGSKKLTKGGSKIQDKAKDKEKRRQLQLDAMMEPKEQKNRKS